MGFAPGYWGFSTKMGGNLSNPYTQIGPPPAYEYPDLGVITLVF
jgi:hypothetical protein